MKFCSSEFNFVIDTENDSVNSLIIENSNLFYRLISDINNQINGDEGISIISKNDKLLSFSKDAECIIQFIPFSINQKLLINKATALMSKLSVSDDKYNKAMCILSEIEEFLLEVSLDMEGDIQFTKLSMDSIVKAVGLEFSDNYMNLCERIIDYMELVRAYDKDKIFFFVNLRSYIDCKEFELFIQTILSHGFHVILIENREYEKVSFEKRHIIDKDLCEIM